MSVKREWLLNPNFRLLFHSPATETEHEIMLHSARGLRRCNPIFKQTTLFWLTSTRSGWSSSTGWGWQLEASSGAGARAGRPRRWWVGSSRWRRVRAANDTCWRSLPHGDRAARLGSRKCWVTSARRAGCWASAKARNLSVVPLFRFPDIQCSTAQKLACALRRRIASSFSKVASINFCWVKRWGCWKKNL